MSCLRHATVQSASIAKLFLRLVLHLFFSPLSAIVLLCLLEAAFANIYTWNGPGRVISDPDPNAASGEELWVHNECVCIYSYLHSLDKMYLCAFVFSVSHRPGVLWLLSDAATDTQDEDVL